MISVIIPMYNAETSILACLNSVVNQTYKGKLEVIVIDDGSRDSSASKVQKFIEGNPSFNIKLVKQANGGVSKARNRGLQLAEGNFIALLDSDDEWMPEKLERQIAVMNKYPKIDFLGCNWRSHTLKIFGRSINTLHRASVVELLYRMFPQTSTALFKKKLFEEFGGYDERMTHAEDGNLWIRYCANSNFYYLPETLVSFGAGKRGYGHSGLSADLKAMEIGTRSNLLYSFRQGYINRLKYSIFFLYYQLKYFRRILISKYL